MFKLCGKVGLPGRQHDQTVNMAVYQRLDALNLRGLIAADAQQQLLRIHVDDGFDFVKQLRTERVVGGRNHQADGVGDGAAQRARRIIDRIVEVCRGRSHAACDVVVFGAFAGKNAGDGGDGDVGQRCDVRDRTVRRSCRSRSVVGCTCHALLTTNIRNARKNSDYSNYCRISIAYSRIKQPPVESGRGLEASIAIMHVALRFHNCDATTEDC